MFPRQNNRTNAGQKMFVRRVCVRVTIGKERNYDSDNSRWFRYAVKFLHHLHDIVEVFDDVITVDFVETVSRKGIGKPVEIVNDVSLRTGIYIDADCAGAFAKSAPQVEDGVCRRCRGRRFFAAGFWPFAIGFWLLAFRFWHLSFVTWLLTANS